jgi:hypothetical protein
MMHPIVAVTTAFLAALFAGGGTTCQGFSSPMPIAVGTGIRGSSSSSMSMSSSFVPHHRASSHSPSRTSIHVRWRHGGGGGTVDHHPATTRRRMSASEGEADATNPHQRRRGFLENVSWKTPKTRSGPTRRAARPRRARAGVCM